MNTIKSLGFRPRIHRLKKQQAAYISETVCENKVKLLKRVFATKDSKVVWCLRGGYGCQRMLPYLWKIREPRQKKILIGYSDITALHWYVNTKWQWPSIHFPVLVHMDKVKKSALARLQSLLEGKQKVICFRQLRLLNPQVVGQNKKDIKSLLVGGNMTLIQTCLGTEWSGGFRHHVLFLEDIGESLYRVDRALWQMRHAGVFNRLRALILGDFITSKNEGMAKPTEKRKWQEFFYAFARTVSFPVLTGLPAGHGKHNEAIILKTPATLSLSPRPCLSVESPFLSHRGEVS